MSLFENRLGGVAYQVRVLFVKGDLYFDRTECRRYSGMSTAPHDTLSAHVGKLWRMKKWGLGETTDIIVYIRSLLSYGSLLRSSDVFSFVHTLHSRRWRIMQGFRYHPHLRCYDSALSVLPTGILRLKIILHLVVFNTSIVFSL